MNLQVCSSDRCKQGNRGGDSAEAGLLTARDENRGEEAVSLLHKQGLSNVVFHQLDVLDKHGVPRLENYLKAQYGRLDILLAGKAVDLIQGSIKTTYEKAKECLDTNYYGVKMVTEALLPLLQRSSQGARIVNISSLRSELRRIPNEQRRKLLGDIDNLTEETVDEILHNFLCDLKDGKLEANGWQMMLPAYSISKATLHAYTRLVAK
ncbi:unnamed protein product, partial [Cuscuta epithymum]